MNFVWSQTALKDLEKPTTCPDRWYRQWILQEFKMVPSEVMDYGNYFEYLCIGKNAKGDPITDLPRTGKGEMTAVQKRIITQSRKFKELTDPLSKQFCGFSVEQTQVNVTGVIGGEKVAGDIDFIGKRSNGNRVIVDLKLAEDIYSTRTEYGWGNSTQNLDLIQQVLYRELFYQSFGIKLDSILMLFEHGTEERVRILQLNIRDLNKSLIESRFEDAFSVVGRYMENGWVKDPSEKECEKCKVQDCSVRKIKTNISYEIVEY